MSIRPACLAVLGLVLVSTAATAAQAPGAAGHWTGGIALPTQTLAIEVDLKPSASPAWVGAIAIPDQKLKGFPLAAIEVQDKMVSFAMTGVPGTPTFTGRLSEDGKTLAGDFTQGEMKARFTLTLVGEAVIATPVKSTAISREIEGGWAGALDVQGRQLRLILKLANGPDGATGSMISTDQGNAEIAIAAIVQTGTHLELQLPAINGGYVADLKDGRLVGTWTQGPGSLPLEFSRVP